MLTLITLHYTKEIFFFVQFRDHILTTHSPDLLSHGTNDSVQESLPSSLAVEAFCPEAIQHVVEVSTDSKKRVFLVGVALKVTKFKLK